MNLFAPTAIDFYKADHRRQYTPGTTRVYSNFTPRSMRLYKGNGDSAVVFGLQGFIKWYLIDHWRDTFFSKDCNKVVKQYKRRLDNALGLDSVPVEHIKELHDLGFIPLTIKGIDEGEMVGAKIPTVTVDVSPGFERFYWLVNYIESVMSAELWKPSTVATIAKDYRRIIDQYALETVGNTDFSAIQGHDFSFRGMSGLHDAASSCSGHLLSFIGTDTVPAIDYLEEYYGADSDNEIVGVSVPATEHSVMCLGQKDDELETFKRIIFDLYPAGVVSVVSDTWDFWKVVTEYMPALKDGIMNRERNAIGLSKVVLRPDSGDPVKILTGYKMYDMDANEELNYPDLVSAGYEAYKYDGVIRTVSNSAVDYNTSVVLSEAEVKGAVECLWDIFGGTMSSKGYKLLDEHIGLIYGDSITLERAEAIMQRLKDKGFASTNVVFGIGSYTYQYNTRDSLGYAMKATYGEVDGVGREIFKDPATDSGTKKSAKGLLRVEKEDGKYVLYDQQTKEQAETGELRLRFCNGVMYNTSTLSEIRARLAAY